MDKIKVGLAPTQDKVELQSYLDWFEENNIDAVLLLPGEDPIIYDALILLGGADIGKNIERDKNETYWFTKAYKNIPVLGVCRGMQLVNVLLGGTLHQDLSGELINHTTNTKQITGDFANEVTSSWHSIHIKDLSLLVKEDNRDDIITVNSRHHQGVDIIPNELQVVAVAEDGLVESLENEHCLLVQWHPERVEVKHKICSILAIEWLKHKIKINEISKNRRFAINKTKGL